MSSGPRGPAPKPTALRVLEGNPANRPLPKDEPKAPPGAPDQPGWLTKEARAHWDEVVPILLKLGTLTFADGEALAEYCDVWARLRKVNRVINQKGHTFTTPNGYVQQRPEVGIAKGLRADLTRLMDRFGMNPSARTRIRLSDSPGAGRSPQDADETDWFLFGASGRVG